MDFIDARMVHDTDNVSVSKKIKDLAKAPNEYQWSNVAAGTLVYKLPAGTTYDPSSKWLEVTVGGAQVGPNFIQKDSPTQFTLLVDPAYIPENVTVIAKWVESFVPASSGHGWAHAKGGQDEIDITRLKNYDLITAGLAANSQALSGIPCKNLGMVPNDSTKATNNYTLLLDAIKQGTKILVDDLYYVTSPYTAADANNLVTADISIVGNNKLKSKLISLGGHFFNCKGNVTINNISLDCQTNKMTYLICLAAPYRVNIEIRNNYITGNIRAVDSAIPVGYDFVANDCGVSKMVIDNNEFFDVYNYSGSRVIFRLSDTPVTLGYIINNKVKNFSYVFYSNGITNGNTSTNYIYSNSKKLYMKGNEVVVEDAYDAVVKNGGFKATYYCFGLTESYSVECMDNRFEGIHMFDAPDTVIYDNYFSVSELLYENNIWKNNVNFTAGIQYVDIMKSKMGSSTDILTRTYRKNTYIVENSYADRFGKDRFMLRKNINTYQEVMDKVVVEDNFFDMYTLSFNRSLLVKDYVFSKNTVKTYTTENSLNTQAYIGIREHLDANGNPVPRQMVFNHNTILVENAPIGGAVGTRVASLITNYTGNGDKVTVIFENNYIKTQELKYILSDERADSVSTGAPCLANIKFNNNTVITERTSNTYIFDKKFKRLYSFKNNHIEASVVGGGSLYAFYEQGTVDAATRFTLPLCMDLELDMKYKADQWLRLLPLKGLLDATYKVSMNVKILGPSTYEEFDVNYTVRNNGTNTIIDCMGMDKKLGETQFTQKSYILDGSAGNYNNFFIQQTNMKGTTTVNVNIANSSTSKEIMLASLSPRAKFDDDQVKIKMTISL